MGTIVCCFLLENRRSFSPNVIAGSWREWKEANMNTHELGRGQEQRVADWMRQQGFYIVEQNFRCKFGEIDPVSYTHLRAHET